MLPHGAWGLVVIEQIKERAEITVSAIRPRGHRRPRASSPGYRAQGRRRAGAERNSRSTRTWGGRALDGLTDPFRRSHIMCAASIENKWLDWPLYSPRPIPHSPAADQGKPAERRGRKATGLKDDGCIGVGTGFDRNCFEQLGRHGAACESIAHSIRGSPPPSTTATARGATDRAARLARADSRNCPAGAHPARCARKSTRPV